MCRRYLSSLGSSLLVAQPSLSLGFVGQSGARNRLVVVSLSLSLLLLLALLIKHTCCFSLQDQTSRSLQPPPPPRESKQAHVHRFNQLPLLLSHRAANIHWHHSTWESLACSLGLHSKSYYKSILNITWQEKEKRPENPRKAIVPGLRKTSQELYKKQMKDELNGLGVNLEP